MLGEKATQPFLSPPCHSHLLSLSVSGFLLQGYGSVLWGEEMAVLLVWVFFSSTQVERDRSYPFVILRQILHEVNSSLKAGDMSVQF